MTEKKKRGFGQRNHLDDYHPSCNHPSGVNHALTVHFSFASGIKVPFPPFVEATPQGKNHSNKTSYVVTFTYDHFSFSFGIVSKSIIFALTSYIPQ